MPTTYKILGQVAGQATTQSLYTVPAGTQAVISSLIVSNHSTSTATYDIAVIPSGSTLSTSRYVARNILMSGSDSSALTLGLTLGQFDSVNVAGVLTGSFSIFGSEIS